MIRAKQTKDILKIVKGYHKEISAKYDTLGENAEDKRVKLLMEYLSKNEREIINSLNIYESDMSEKVLNTFFRFLPDPETIEVCRSIDAEKQYSIEETRQMALQMDKCFVSLYQSIINHTDVPEVKTVFQRILKEVKHSKYVLSRETLELGDL